MANKPPAVFFSQLGPAWGLLCNSVTGCYLAGPAPRIHTTATPSLLARKVQPEQIKPPVMTPPPLRVARMGEVPCHLFCVAICSAWTKKGQDIGSPSTFLLAKNPDSNPCRTRCTYLRCCPIPPRDARMPPVLLLEHFEILKPNHSSARVFPAPHCANLLRGHCPYLTPGAHRQTQIVFTQRGGSNQHQWSAPSTA